MKWKCMLATVLGLSTLSAHTVWAHDGQPPAPHDLWSAWNWEPTLVLCLVFSGWIYRRGLRVLRRRAVLRQSVLHWRKFSFVMGMMVLFLALISPLDALGSALFSAHMLQHMLLILIAPPLLILGVPLGPFLLGLSSTLRRRMGNQWRRAAWLQITWRGLTYPIIAWSFHTLAVWLWHAPFLYEAALQNEVVHLLEHFSFLGTALLFWWTILHPHKDINLGTGFSMLALFTMVLQGGLLGALIAFAPTPWYTSYAETTQPWGLSPLEDQQLAGVLMWIPAGIVYTLVALRLFIRRLAWIELVAQKREDHPPGEKETISILRRHV